MPEFILDTSGKAYRSISETSMEAVRWADLDAFTQGYIEALFFTSDEELADDAHRRTTGLSEETEWHRKAESGFGFSGLAPETLAQIIDDCAAFQRANARTLDAAYERDYDAAQAGRDFWFTRNGHGVGFWERPALDAREAWEALGRPKVGEPGWAEFVQARADSLGDQLTRAAKAFGEVDPYLGDDGRVYLA